MTTPKIPCPHCQHYESRVVDCRPAVTGIGFLRWRECLQCHTRYRTTEVLHLPHASTSTIPHKI